ncbi:POTRA domain-containing protein [Candidatus Poribacteria bacterium]
MLVHAHRRTYVVFVLYIALLIYAMAVDAEVTLEHQIEESFSSETVSLVVVKSTNGNVRLSAWERPEVLVKALKKVSADSDEKAQEYLGKVDMHIEQKEGKLEIETRQPTLSTILKKVNISLEYDIFVPEDMELDIGTRNGSVYVTGIRSREKITTGNGNIELKNVAGSVSATTGNGNIYAEILFDAASNFLTIDGSIDIRIGDDFSVPISARTVSGPINVILPEGYPADIDATAVSGTVTCEVPFDGAIKGRSLRGKIFGGGPLMKLDTVAGNIAIVGAIDAPSEKSEEVVAEVEELPSVAAVKTSTPPVIDGKLDDECWKSAGIIRNFVSADGVDLADEPTEAYLLWDDEKIYIGIKCYESRMETIAIATMENDRAGIWDDDNIQILIDIAPDPKGKYYHLTISPIGTVFDQEVDNDFAAKRWGTWSGRGTEWSSDGLFGTDISGNFWSVEAEIPFSSMKVEPGEGDVWRLNLHRMGQYSEEYTYWSPTYREEEWPHVPSRFGGLMFSVEQPVEETPPEQPIPSEEALTISRITIEGNDKVSQEEIMEALQLESGDAPDEDALSQAKSRLMALGWFRDVETELTESDKGVDLTVAVTERNIISPSAVEVRGAELFTEQQIIDFFSLTPDRTAMHEVKVKCKLIEKLHKIKGYDMAAVSCSVISDTLVIDINGGRIDKIVIAGNRKISDAEVFEALDTKVGMLYKRNEVENSVRNMQDRITYFRSVNWEPERTDDGLNVIYVNVVEDTSLKTRLDDVSEFNRVHGFQWGLRTETESRYTGLKGSFEFRYGFSSEVWNYQFAVEKSWFRRHRMSIGVDVHKLTDTNDWELVSNDEHVMAELILGEAWRDFYQRKGYELNFSQKLTSATEFGVKYRDDKYKSLEKTNDWSLLDRAYEDDNWSDDFRWTGGRSVRKTADIGFDNDDKQKPENPPIVEGTMRSLIAEYTIDTRNVKRNPNNGWLNTLSVEHAGLDSDFNFNLYKANIRRYNRLGRNQHFFLRVKAATTDRSLPGLHPRKLYLGGIGTLRGYWFKEFAGDKMLLINAEYWIITGWPPGIGVVFFVDSGYAWPYNTETDLDDMKTNVGIGCQLGDLRVNLAMPVREDNRDTIFSVRLARMF